MVSNCPEGYIFYPKNTWYDSHSMISRRAYITAPLKGQMLTTDSTLKDIIHSSSWCILHTNDQLN